MSTVTQKNKQVLKHVFEAVNKGDISQMKKELAEILTPDYVLHGSSNPNLQPGRDNYIEFFDQDSKNFGEFQFIVEDMFGFEDKVVTRGFFSSVELKSHEKTTMAVIVISRFEHGKIAEEWQVMAPVTSSSG